MRSIKNKLLTGIILINSIILIGICIFRFGFEDFYIKQTSKELSKFGRSVGDLIGEGPEDDLINYISKYGESKNVSIDIYYKNDLLIFTNNYTSMNRNDNNMVGKRGMSKKNRFVITNEYIIDKNLESYVISDKLQGIEFLATITQLDNNLYSIVCKTPISAIKNSVDTASSFLFIIFIPIIVLS
ncbi:hypothetical protein, partial [Romboutsia sp.]|uniref:hypothetical protein n=1 Tax=Romboutsia sp. TaxID=1965302 RepID=UPI002C29CB8E